MNRMLIKKAIEELELKAKAKGKRLLPEDVVKAAKSPQSPLHSEFQWDDSKAAAQYRLFQARSLIRAVKLSVPEGSIASPAPQYIALKSDVSDGGGYRNIKDIVSNEELVESLRNTALSELRGWIKRYKTLISLVGPVAEAAGLEDLIESEVAV